MSDMGRKRAHGNRDLPANLYPASRGRWKYVHPVTRKVKYWSVPRERAKDAARKLNAILMPQTSDLVSCALNEGQRLSDAIRVFREEDLALRKIKPATRAIIETRVARIEADRGHLPLDELTVKECATYLRQVTDSQEARNRYRALLVDMLDCAVQEGWLDMNPAAATRRIRTADIDKKRGRLTLEAFNAIREHAQPWLQNAMDISLITLLRRSDVCNLQFSDYRQGKLHVIPAKTDGNTQVKLRIATDEALIAQCRDNVASPYLVHKLPGRSKPSDRRAPGRTHHTQVMPEQLSRAFSEARDASGYYPGNTNPPTFHEIRSLGGKLYKDKGWDLKQVQALMGHASEDMTSLYMSGHELPWTDVTAEGFE